MALSKLMAFLQLVSAIWCYNNGNDDIPDPDFLIETSHVVTPRSVNTDFPDPDFFIANSHDVSSGNEDTDFSNKVIANNLPNCFLDDKLNRKLPGYFKFIIRELINSNLLSENERYLFDNADSVDPQTLSEIIVKLIFKDSPHEGQQLDGFFSSLPNCFAPLIHGTYLAGFLYITFMFILCYMNKKCRHFIISFHVVAVYLGAVYSKMSKQYSDIKGAKMAAITSMPRHCEEGFTLSSMMSLAWSKLQIGDHCRKYNQQILSDPLYEIEYHKWFIYPIISLLSIPLVVLGEEIGPFLENVLSPFPFHLQMVILIFLTVIIAAITFIVCSTMRQNVHIVQNNDQITPIMDDLLENITHLKRDMKVLKESYQMNTPDIMVLNSTNDSCGQ